MVLFHGGGGHAEKILPMMEQHALSRGFLLLVPQSQFPTWDIVIAAGNGPDQERLDVALKEVAAQYRLDPPISASPAIPTAAPMACRLA